MSIKEDIEKRLGDAETLNSTLNSFLSVEHDHASGRIAEIGDAGGPLHGTAIAVKDNICTKGLRTSCGSRILRQLRRPLRRNRDSSPQ